ncbi:MAG: hypothetical protein H6727_07340 [Myxococcales bacterium]|nr:hypothetical protein [Myxococcales bacterium]
MKKLTDCQSCGKTFWYVDPRPGGRPRQKCGLCSSRPPRYPWGFIDPNQPDSAPNDLALATMLDLPLETSSKTHTTTHEPSIQGYADTALVDSCPMPAYPSVLHTPTEKTHRTTTSTRTLTTLGGAVIEITDNSDQHEGTMPSNGNLSFSRRKQDERQSMDHSRLEAMEARLSTIEERLDELEKRFDRLEATSITRSEWIDICARLDIVEQHTSETLERVRKRLDGFTREARNIAVIPERELQEINQVMRSIRAYLHPNIDDKTPRGGNR